MRPELRIRTSKIQMPKKKAAKKKRPVPRPGLERPYNGGTWTRARYLQFIRTALRRASARWGPRFEALKEAETEGRINKATGRMAKHYRCAHCGHDFPAKEVDIDHITPVGSLKSLEDLPGFVGRLLCEKEGFQVLCRPCHSSKSSSSSS